MTSAFEVSACSCSWDIDAGEEVFSDSCVDSAMYKFTAASKCESIVFGASRAGYKEAQVNDWITFMKRQKVQRVCCLLASSQLTRYAGLLDAYRKAFGEHQVCWTPIEDFDLVKSSVLLSEILPFLVDADRASQRVVVHCSGGVGRTGQVLAAWLVAKRRFSENSAVAAVKATGRNPYEAVWAAPFRRRSPLKVRDEFRGLLAECKKIRSL